MANNPTDLAVVGLVAPAAVVHYNDIYKSGQAKMQAAKYTEARQDYEQALALASNAAERAEAQIAIGLTSTAEKKYDAARAEFEKALAIEGIAPARQVQAQMGIGRSLERYCADKMVDANRAYTDAIVSYAKVADIAGVSARQKYDARMAVANTFMTIKNYGAAGRELKDILQDQELPAAGGAQARFALAHCLFYDRKYAAARDEFARALAIKELPEANQAAAQLKIGQCYYAERAYERARTELNKVLTMPGADQKQIREVKLCLALRKLGPGNEKTLTVLFIGASQTQVFDVPRIVEVLSDSAPAGSPRIVTSGYLRGGTGIQRFWEEGGGPGTARERIMAEPWSCVVYETHPLLFGQDIFVKYATQFAGLIRGNHATPIFFEAPAFFRHSYPEAYQKIHDATVELGKALNVPVAPADYAWMKYLGPTPTADQRMALYRPDAVHPSKQGAYLIACSIYSAITGLSPIGLTHSIPSFAPEGISPEEAARLQKAAWAAFLETKAAYVK